MLQIEPETVRGLRALLDDLQYDTVQHTLRPNYFQWPFPALEHFLPLLDTLGERERLTYQVLMLGRPARRATLEKLWSRPLVDRLLAAGLLELDASGRVRTANYSIVSYLDRYFVVTLNPYYSGSRDPDASVYIGADSLTLAASLPFHVPFARGLDLCTGSGIQAILAAATTREVTAVELNEQAANAARFNAALNGVAERVHVVTGNLYAAAPAGPYDLILSNPPFLPVPQGVHHAMCGNGGIDGMVVLRPLLEGIPERLAEGGMALIYAEGVGDDEGPFVRHLLRDLAHANGLACQIVVTSRLSVKSVLVLKAVSLARLKRPSSELVAWRDLYQQLRASQAYNYLLRITRGAADVRQLMAFDPRREEQGVEVRPGVVIKPQ